MARTYLVFVIVACTGCTLDFSIFEVRDGGSRDAAVRDAGRRDAGQTDAGSRDAGGVDAGTCAAVDCVNASCAGAACDDGRPCTIDDRCVGGTCAGTLNCPTDGCTTAVCDDATGSCVVASIMPEATPCPDGRCCFGRCSNLQDSGNCGGCGLACEEMGCLGGAPTRCTCVTSAGCSRGQQCVGGLCTCGDNSQCATGQTCVLPAGTCSY